MNESSSFLFSLKVMSLSSEPVSFESDNQTLSNPKIKWRHYENFDYNSVNNLLISSTFQMFGNFELKQIIFESPIVLVHENENYEIIGFIALKFFPNIPALDPSVWIFWLEYFYQISSINYENTFFVHAFCCDQRYRCKLLLQILFKNLFLDYYRIQNICFIAPPKIQFIQYYNDLLEINFFKLYYPVAFEIDQRERGQFLIICEREHFLPKIVIRHAVAEDNDDLVEILDRECPKLKETYGEFYIAEIILKESTSTRVMITAEYQNQAIGMICVNSDVDLDKILNNFLVNVFHGLRKHTESEKRSSSYSLVADLSVSVFPPLDGRGNDDDDYNLVHDKGVRFRSRSFSDPTTSFSFDDYNSIYSATSQTSSPTSSESDTFINKKFKSLCAKDSMTTVSISSLEKSKSSINLIHDHFRTQQDSILKRHRKTSFVAQKQLTSEINVFAIELYGIHQDYDPRIGYSLLEAIFETFPDREYCLISMPTEKCHIFIQLCNFVKVIPKYLNTFEHDIYIMFRNTIHDVLSVRFATIDDASKIKIFLGQIPNHGLIKEDFITGINNYEKGIPVFPIIILNGKTTIGFCLVEIYTDFLYLKVNYDLETYVDLKLSSKTECHGLIKHLYLASMYRPRSQFVINEISRLTGIECFYYFLPDNLKRTFTSILLETRPIKPRIKLDYDEKLGENLPAEYVTRPAPLMPLYFINLKLANQKKAIISTRIVIIGPSACAISFLETLIYLKAAQNFWFSNLTLVGPNGNFELQMQDHTSLNYLRTRSYLYDWKYLLRIGLKTWVNIVHGSLTRIDRSNKLIILDNDRKLKYDRLYLFCGLQYGIPLTIKYENDTLPLNFVVINNYVDAENFKIKLNLLMAELVKMHQSIYEKKNVLTPTIIIYGRSVDSYSVLEYIINQGYPESGICFIKPPTNSDGMHVAGFNDPFVIDRVATIIKRLSISVHTDYKLVDWYIDKKNLIKTVRMESNSEIKEFDCKLFISCNKKYVDMNTIKAFNESGIVLDGRLVIDENFQTNEPNIYAAGPIAKYRRNLYAENFRHEYFNSIEIGKCVAMKLISKYNPDFKLKTKNELYKKIYKFKKPKIVFTKLPGRLNYLQIQTPGPEIPYEAHIALDNYGYEIITGDPKFVPRHAFSELEDYGSGLGTNMNMRRSHSSESIKSQELQSKKKIPRRKSLINDSINYFRLVFDEFNHVSHIVCLTYKDIKVHNIINLWGKHEKLLNNLISRYEANIITDLLYFLQEDSNFWPYAILHDRFPQLFDLNLDVLSNMDKFANESFTRQMQKIIDTNHDSHLSEKQKKALVKIYLKVHENELEQNVLEFIDVYRDELPMFAHPNDVEKFLEL